MNYKPGDWVWKEDYRHFECFYYIERIDRLYVRTIEFSFNSKEFEAKRVLVYKEDWENDNSKINMGLGASREIIVALFSLDTKNGIYL